jgi:hypothetical protein
MLGRMWESGHRWAKHEAKSPEVRQQGLRDPWGPLLTVPCKGPGAGVGRRGLAQIVANSEGHMSYFVPLSRSLSSLLSSPLLFLSLWSRHGVHRETSGQRLCPFLLVCTQNSLPGTQELLCRLSRPSPLPEDLGLLDPMRGTPEWGLC